MIRKFIDWIKALLRKKEKPQTRVSKKKVFHRKQTFHHIEVIPKFKRKKNILDYPQVIPKVKRKPPSDIIEKNVIGIKFTFDKETYKLFLLDFCGDGWEIDYDDMGCYLQRVNKYGYKEDFHRWLMYDKIDDFAEEHKLETGDVIVHHCNHEHTDNRLSNFKLMTREDHHAHHKKEKAYKTWSDKTGGTRTEFEEWYFQKH